MCFKVGVATTRFPRWVARSKVTVLKGLLPGEVLCLGLKSIREVSHRDDIYIYIIYIYMYTYFLQGVNKTQNFRISPEITLSGCVFG